MSFIPMQNSIMHETAKPVTHIAYEVKYLLLQEKDEAVRQFMFCLVCQLRFSIVAYSDPEKRVEENWAKTQRRA